MTLIVYLILWLWLEQERLAAEAAAAEAVRLEEERLAAEAAEAERLAVEAAEEERLAVEAAAAKAAAEAAEAEAAAEAAAAAESAAIEAAAAEAAAAAAAEAAAAAAEAAAVEAAAVAAAGGDEEAMAAAEAAAAAADAAAAAAAAEAAAATAATAAAVQDVGLIRQASVARQASKNSLTKSRQDSLTKSRQGSLASLITSPDAITAVATPPLWSGDGLGSPSSIPNQRPDLSSTIGSTTGAPGVYSSRNWASPRLLAQRVTGGMQRLVYRRDPVEYGKGPTHYVPTKPSQPVYGHRTYRTTKSDRGPNTSPPKDRLPSMPLDRLAAVVMAGSPTMFTGKAADPPWLGGRGVTPAAPPHTSKNLVRV